MSRFTTFLFALCGAIQSASFASETLHCTEFKTMFSFIENNHLRFQDIRGADKNKLLEEAFSKVPHTLERMGYPMLSAQFSILASQDLRIKMGTFDNLNTICLNLKNTVFRAAFLKSYLRNLDPYSDFFTSEELDIKTASLEGEFTGVGIGTEPSENFLKVTEVVQGSPADGRLQINDLIEKIDGHPVAGLSESEIRQRIRGPKKTAITFDGHRGKNQFRVGLIRDQIQQKSIETTLSDNQFLTIRVKRFYRQTALEVETALRENAGKTKGIILDLRNNPGGLLQAARDLVDLFISQGVVVYLRGRQLEDQVWALKDGAATQVPMVVLVNSETASAAEIAAGALQDFGRAVVIGQKTYGKGCVQNIFETQASVGTLYRGGIKITTLWYYLPSGRSVRSLTPDILLASPTEPTDHPVMPYQGPSNIVVPRELKNLMGTKILNFKQSQKLFKDTHDYELVGKTLLRDMQAIR